MSRLLLNITHETTGQLNLGIQTDNADQQVALLQHQLGDAMRKADEPARVAKLETIVAAQREEIAKLHAAKKPARRR
jgi:hypothetical protein